MFTSLPKSLVYQDIDPLYTEFITHGGTYSNSMIRYIVKQVTYLYIDHVHSSNSCVHMLVVKATLLILGM